MKERQLGSTTHPIAFFMVLSTDRNTGATGLSPTVTLSKDGGPFGPAAGAVTELASGWYLLAGNATDRGTLGGLLIHATATGADPVDDRYTIVGYDPFNAINLGLTGLPTAALNSGAGSFNLDASGNVKSTPQTGVTVTTNSDKTGYTVSTVSDKTGYALTQAFPSNFAALGITAGGAVQLDLTEAVPTANTANTVGDCLNAARAQGFGKWVWGGTVLTLYAPDGVTVVRTFSLNSATAPTIRM